MGLNTNRENSDRLVARLDGAVNFRTVPDLRKDLLRVARPPEIRRVEVDFSEVEELNTAGIAMLVELLQILKNRDGNLRLVGLGERAKKVLRLSRLQELFDVD